MEGLELAFEAVGQLATYIALALSWLLVAPVLGIALFNGLLSRRSIVIAGALGGTIGSVPLVAIAASGTSGVLVVAVGAAYGVILGLGTVLYRDRVKGRKSLENPP